MAKVKLIFVTEPVVVMRFNRYNEHRLYMLPDERHAYNRYNLEIGPCFVLERGNPNSPTVTTHNLNDADLWAGIGFYCRSGVWAVTNKAVAKYLPDDLADGSPRFIGTTKEQRQRMSRLMRRK